MNKVERLVYDLLKGNPKLKQTVRNIYQFGFDLLPRKSEFSINPISIKESCFLGFHDIQPFSVDNSKLLSNKLSFDLRMPKEGEVLEVGYIKIADGKLGEFVKLGESTAWNFHKGCRLQWRSADEVVFNSSENNKLVSNVLNLNGTCSTLSYPVDTVSECGTFATSFSYERLEKYMPGYGYPYTDDISYIDELAPVATGLFLVDLTTGLRKLLVSLQELAERTKNEEASIGSHHYVTHTEFSKDSRFISFLHRWVGQDKQKRYTKLMVYDLKEAKLITLPITNNMASHYVWNYKNQIIAYCNFEGVDCHALLDVENISNSRKVAYPQLNSDGHQSFINDDQFITDTYPDKWRMAKLSTVDISSNTSKLVASIYSPKKYQTKDFTKHIACDLHPRVSADGQLVCFDTVKSGKRSIAIMGLKDHV